MPLPALCAIAHWRGSSTSQPIGSITSVSGILDRRSSRAMAPAACCRHAFTSSRRFRPSFAIRLMPSMKGRREGRAPAGTRGPSCDEMHTQCTTDRQVKPKTSGLPCAMFDGVWRALPGDDFLLASVTPRIDGAHHPVGLGAPPQGLAVATTARTTRFSRTHRSRSSARSRDLMGLIPPCSRLSCTTPLRPSLPDPRLVTTYDRPFRRIRMGDTYAETKFR